MDKYTDLIHQTFDFPTEEFTVHDNELFFNGIPMMELVKQYGTPLRLTYLPKISSQIQKAKILFRESMEKLNYQGTYTYCYCTKSSHFSFVLEEALKNDIHIETSSSFDMPIIRALYEKGKVNKDVFVVCNGFKRELYRDHITSMLNDGFKNVTPVLDHLGEIDHYEQHVNGECQVGIRLASDEEPKFQFYTSRLGINYNDVVDLYKNKIANNPKFKLKMLHYFINTGIKDTSYYWSELSRFVHKYCEMKKLCPELDTIDIGGGFPIKTSIQFDYNYRYMIEEILRTIQNICKAEGVPEPNIFTEFGIYTVGESGAHVYSILDTKLQNDKELWYMIDGSFITNLPDTWALNQRYILLALNNWDKNYQRLNIGGLTCDSQDYYNSEMHSFQVFLPKIQKEQPEPQYIGFFHTGAYQESLSGYGGIKHCLIPSPKHIIIDREANGELKSWVFAEEQDVDSMLQILGYKD
ncbi:type III PLP-dependent enzyme domain-containing protein [Rufibacter hautae]|uniref:Arginine decarboxylase n=1 Tax=Rufibacter hautae TaxID=2595005 RepID=A0A5B6TAL4_9BACT|nr:arginine decarboxylase [Rufibacter hautae]KAA3437487.1 arginine decarboxylase [Rufibacter hautae]